MINFETLIKLENSFSNILFYEKDHKYTIDGIPARMSVSQLIKKFEKPFNSKAIAEVVAKRDGFSVEEILDQWDFKRDYSCHKWSEFHKYVENFFNRKQISLDKTAINFFFESKKTFKTENSIKEYYQDVALLVKNFKNFYNWWKKEHILIKSEFVVGDPETGVCGTIDNLSYNFVKNEFVIFDYKTNKEIKRKGFKGDKMIDCLSHLDQCEFIKYSLQLSLYSTIFEKMTDFIVPNSYIIWVNDEKDYELIECLDLKKESKTILNNCKY